MTSKRNYWCCYWLVYGKYYCKHGLWILFAKPPSSTSILVPHNLAMPTKYYIYFRIPKRQMPKNQLSLYQSYARGPNKNNKNICIYLIRLCLSGLPIPIHGYVYLDVVLLPIACNLWEMHGYNLGLVILLGIPNSEYSAKWSYTPTIKQEIPLKILPPQPLIAEAEGWPIKPKGPISVKEYWMGNS